MCEERRYQKKGYLEGDFRLFRLSGAENRDFQNHYHDFHKLLFFEGGHASYYIEGKTYELRPDDIVLVTAGEIHRPVIHDDFPYQRLILYLSPAFFARYQDRCDLFRCFRSSQERGGHVMRILRFRESRIAPVLAQLIATTTPQAEGEPASDPSAGTLYQEALLVQLLILLNRAAKGSDLSLPPASVSDPQILRVLSYVSHHLTEELSVSRVAEACYLSPSYLMHRFRQETGDSLMGYITEKRLFTARTLIQSGIPVAEAGERSGFPSYAAFYRACQKKFRQAPGEFRRPQTPVSPSLPESNPQRQAAGLQTCGAAERRDI